MLQIMIAEFDRSEDGRKGGETWERQLPALSFTWTQLSCQLGSSALVVSRSTTVTGGGQRLCNSRHAWQCFRVLLLLGRH